VIASTFLYAGLVAAGIGAICLIRPLRVLRIRTRPAGATVFVLGVALASATALLPSRLVRSASAHGGDASFIDDLMPDYHFSERHEVHVQASPEHVYAAIQHVRPGEIRLFLLLTGIRSLRPARIFGGGVPPLESQPPMMTISPRGGFQVLKEEPGREIVLGVCGQFWRVRGQGRCPGINSPDGLLAFNGPGYAKATINFRVVPEGDGCRVTTETRILATDDAARRRFAAYWRLIYPGSALIRRGWLEAIKRRAESPGGDGARS
jgi:hypothetical protein